MHNPCGTKINRFPVPEDIYEKQNYHFLQNDAKFDHKSYEVFTDEQMDEQTHTTLCAQVRAILFKGSPITKALTCMKIYLYKQKWQFCQGD